MLYDMRDFTALSDRLPETRVLELNIYFDQIVPPIVDAGGEILKFMGDAVLAFFRSDADSATNCSAASELTRRQAAHCFTNAMIEEIDVRIRYAKGAPIALCEPLSPAGLAWLCDHVRGRRSWLSRSAIINAPRELLTAIKAMQCHGLAVY
jgi:hypothetical protein